MSVVIVGAGHAGGQVAASLRQLKYEGPITLIGSEAYVPYQRPAFDEGVSSPANKDWNELRYDPKRFMRRTTYLSCSDAKFNRLIATRKSLT